MCFNVGSAKELKCPICQEVFVPTGSRSKYCSLKCRVEAKTQVVNCSICNKSYKVSRWHYKRSKTLMCMGCYSSQTSEVWQQRVGDKHPQWRGGQTYWINGKKSTDPQGLRWKTQRDLARERDKNTCQHCKLEKAGLPVHHIIPYRISHSHALDNLITLCPSCHTTADLKIREAGTPIKSIKPAYPPCVECGTTKVKYLRHGRCHHCAAKHKGGPYTLDPAKHCVDCGSYIYRKKVPSGVCSLCQQERDKKLVQGLLLQGHSVAHITSETNVSRTQVYRYRSLLVALSSSFEDRAFL